MATRKLTF